MTRLPDRMFVIPKPPYCVYVLCDPQGVTVYVGMTTNLIGRLEHHARRPWWGRVVRVYVYDCETRPEAMTLETDMIRSLRPPENIYLY